MRTTSFSVPVSFVGSLVISGAISFASPSISHAQVGNTGLGPEQWRHWSGKVTASAATFAALDLLDAPPDLSAVIATVAPTVVGKLLYMPKGLSDKPGEGWPDASFVAKDVVGELCVQSAPLWARFVMRGKERRLLRGVLAVGGYGMAVLACARTFEVR
jgi:hypothetical protein